MTGDLSELHGRLLGYPRNGDAAHWHELAAEAHNLIYAARDAGDDDSANRAWHLKTVAGARATMSELFAQMGQGEFRAAWNALERIEKMVEALERNAILDDEFGSSQLGGMVAGWQALYPYTVFASPELVIKRQHCTICDAPVSPMSPCGHLPGRVYAGRFCARRIVEVDALSIALVRDPVQKYSVLLPKEDPNDYARLRFVRDRLRGPFSRWRLVHTTILHDHSNFEGWSRKGNCPCHSGYQYADCCAHRSGVRLPHDQILFEEEPPSGLPRYLLRRRSHEDGELEDVTIAPR